MNKGINKDEMLKLADKIELYKSEESKLQETIKKILEEIKLYLSDDNYKTICSRLDNLYDDFQNSILNKERYTQLVLNVVSSYENAEVRIAESLK